MSVRDLQPSKAHAPISVTPLGIVMLSSDTQLSIDNKEVSWLPSYGPEMRGGTCNCSICISDEPVGSPLVNEPDILVVMNTPSFEKFIGTVKAGGKVFVDSTMVDVTTDRKDVDVYYLPATQMAHTMIQT